MTTVRCSPQLKPTGFTLIELMVTIAVIAIAAALAMPSMGSAIRQSRARTVTEKFLQDYSWLRGRANGAAVSLTLHADCSWAASVLVNGVPNSLDQNSHSLTSTALQQQAPGYVCSSGTLALPATFAFTPQGFVQTPSGGPATGTFTLGGGSGQAWPLQVLYSGALIRTQGAY